MDMVWEKNSDERDCVEDLAMSFEIIIDALPTCYVYVPVCACLF